MSLKAVNDSIFDIYNVENIRTMFSIHYEEKQFIIDKTGVKTLEILNASFVANRFAIFGEIDDSYLEKEMDWYLSQKQNINAMKPPVPALWKSTAGLNGETNSNYGWAVFHEDNYQQFDNVVNELAKNPHSRRACMIYTRPSMWRDYNAHGKNDFMCTNNVQYFIRNNKLEAQVYMRSNDAVFGYKCDRHWQMYVRDKVFQALTNYHPSLQRGSIMWNVSSLHVYERHFYLIEYFLKTKDPHGNKKKYEDVKT